jgi:hypothetical protein
MDEPIRKKGEVWCVVIGSDRDWMRSGGGIYMIAGCSHGWKNVHYGRKGSQTLRIDTKYSLCVIGISVFSKAFRPALKPK